MSFSLTVYLSKAGWNMLPLTAAWKTNHQRFVLTLPVCSQLPLSLPVSLSYRIMSNWSNWLLPTCNRLFQVYLTFSCRCMSNWSDWSQQTVSSLFIWLFPVGVCPAGQIGRFPHATDCSKFIMCANEEGHEFSCPSGLLYDPPTKDCTWPEKANCRPTGINLSEKYTLTNVNLSECGK